MPKPSMSRVVTLLAVLLAAGCVDAPFARVNPNDAGADFTLRIEASSDTVSATLPVVVLQLVTEPATSGYEPVWTVSPSGVLSQVGNGVYQRVPGGFAAVTVRASYGGRSVVKVITRLN
jgi:hypothetical protein